MPRLAMNALAVGLGLCIAALASAPANALLCNAILGCSCNVDATAMSFGQIQPLSGTAGSASSDVSVTCTNVIDVAPSVSVKFGAGLWGTTADRQMKDAAGDRLHYNIYKVQTPPTTILGDGTNGFPTVNVSGGLLNLGGWSATTTVYGSAPAVSSIKPGVYGDTVTVRIDW